LRGVPECIHECLREETQIVDVGERMAAEQKLAPVRTATDLAVQTINGIRSKCSYRFIKLRDLCVTVADPWAAGQAVR